jgi:hypothetical protein
MAKRFFIALSLTLLAATGCGGKNTGAPGPKRSQAQAATASREEAATPTPEPPPARELPPALAIDDGSERFVLEPTWESGQLCVYEATSAPQDSGWTAGIEMGNCALRVDTVRPWVSYGGKSDLEVDWAGVLGLAEPEVKGVVLYLADGTKHDLELKKWPRSRWLSFDYVFRGRPFPSFLVAYDSEGRAMRKVEIGSRIVPSCFVDEVCEHDSSEMPRRTWIEAVDVSEPARLELTQPQAQETYELVKHDDLLRRIVGAQSYVVGEIGVWYTCDYDAELGTWAYIYLTRPGTFARRWPQVEIVPAKNSWIATNRWARRAKIDSFLVLVEAKSHRIVAVTPAVDGDPVFRDDALYNSTMYGLGEPGETCAPWLE